MERTEQGIPGHASSLGLPSWALPVGKRLGTLPLKSLLSLRVGTVFIYNILKRQTIIKIHEVTILSPVDSISKKVETLISELTEKT